MRFLASMFTAMLAVTGIRSASIKQDYFNDIVAARTMFNAYLLPFLDHHNDDGKNILVSPYGLHSALSSVLVGAEDKTYQQLFDVLGYKQTKLNRDTLLDAYEQTFDNMTKLADYGLTFSNLLVVDKELELQDKFRNEIGKSFGAGLLKEDFKHNPEQATKEINDWANTVTKGKIPKLFGKPLDKDTKAILANALHLKANWRTQFDPERNYESEFHTSKGETKQVTYMTMKSHQLKGSQYKRFFGFEVVRIPFDNAGRLWFSFLIADYPVQTNFDVLTSFTELIETAEDREIDLTFPKFNITHDNDKIVDALKSFGVSDLFNQDSADLSGIDGKRDLYVSQIAHKTKIQVDETGVEGAAVTAVVIPEITSVHENRVPPQPVFVDRPFMFVISDKETRAHLFTGLVYDPTQ